MHRRSAFAARFSRRVLLGAANATLALSLAGCGLMDAPQSPAPSRRPVASATIPAPTPDATDEVPTDRPVPPGAVDLIGAADALADHRSYRVGVVTRGLVPSSAADGSVTMTSTLVLGDHPAAAFTLAGVDGFEGVGSGPIQAVVIGDEAWIRSGSGAWRKSPGGAADFDAAFTTLSPTELVGAFESLAPAFVRVASETTLGQSTTHYRVDRTDQAAADAGFTTGAIDVWLARPGGELISIVADGTFDVDGTATAVLLRIDVTHIDDPANRVRPPI
jgi:hypothetical protein